MTTATHTPSLEPARMDIDAALHRLGAVDLAALDDRAALRTRRDRKYVVPVDVAEQLVRMLPDSTAALEIGGVRRFGYESTYFDTPDLVAYRLAATRRPSRFKVRTRTYGRSTDASSPGGRPSQATVLEVKIRSRRGRTHKHRWPHAGDDADLGPDARTVLADFDQIVPFVDDLRPTLVTRYTRATLLLRDAVDARATLDTALVCTAIGAPFGTPDPRQVGLPGQVIVETKSTGAATVLDRLLWAHGFRPTTISKYATGLAALRPDLPANRWHRTLRHHFGCR